MSVNETVDAIAYLIASLTLLGAWVAVAAYGLMPFEALEVTLKEVGF